MDFAWAFMTSGDFFLYGTVYIPRLAKRQPLMQPRKNFLHGAVVNDLGKGNDKFRGIGNLVKILDYSFGDFSGAPSLGVMAAMVPSSLYVTS